MSGIGPGAIRATSRPGVILAIAACRLFCGVCLAYPLSSLLSTSGIGQRAEGDRLLFEGGGYLLLEIARLQGPLLTSAARGLLPVLGLGLLLTAACNSVLLVALSDGQERRAQKLLGSALARLPTVALVSVLAGLAQAALLLFASIGAEAIPEPLARPVAASAGQGAVWLVAAALAGAVGGVADLAKAASVRAEASVARALEHARRCLLHRPLSACFGWLPYAGGFVALVAFAAELTERLDVSRPGGGRVFAVFVVHQLVIVGGVALRAAWYAKALRVVSTTAV